MIQGFFGWSLLFELFVLYYALHLWLTSVNKRWVYLLVGLLTLISVSDLTGFRWAEIFSGNYDLFWKEILENVGFR